MVATRSSGKAKVFKEDPILRHWHEAVLDNRLAHLVKDTARVMVRGLQMRLVQYEVPFGHWTSLRILWVTDGLTQKELSDEAGMTAPIIFNVVSMMGRLGYIERYYAPGNRKNTHVYLMACGRSPRSKLVLLAEEADEISVGGLKATEVSIACKVLLTIIENMARDEAETDDPVPWTSSMREMGNLIASRGEE